MFKLQAISLNDVEVNKIFALNVFLKGCLLIVIEKINKLLPAQSPVVSMCVFRIQIHQRVSLSV